MLFAADNIQITKKEITNAMNTFNAAPIQKIIKECVNNGATIIDVNTGPLGKNAVEKMEFFINAVQEISDLPIMIDTANPVVMAAGLSFCKNKTIINGFSLEPNKLEKILPLAKKYDSDIVGYLLYNDSCVPSDKDERFNIAISIFHALTDAGIEHEKLIIDPVLVPLSWENGAFQAMEVLEVIKILPELLDFPVRTIIGLSNLTTGKGRIEKKLIMEKAYAGMLAAAGIDIILLNAMHKETMQIAKAGAQLAGSGIFSWEL